ncbi:Pro-Pol polyprotein like [Argiope bruennichi]|uniref:Pro-Pol polyprotein like n=1 Tax=Argiope bruennichi TaxID=94029 RepID=A0A8T0E8T3_ARGBR|nr:Pro-Pol polyprotein like [Argiope bruennichi]
MCDVSRGTIRPYVPETFRKVVFDIIHWLSHPEGKTTAKLIKYRFIWPSLQNDCIRFSKNCIKCHKSKISTHSKPPVGQFPLVSARFSHIHLDIVGPLPPPDGHVYCLTCVDRFSRWTEVFPMSDMKFETCVETFLQGWIVRFGVPDIITTDQLLYGEPLRLPGEFFRSYKTSLAILEFIRQLKTKIQSLQPVPASNHAKHKVFLDNDLAVTIHVFVRRDSIRRPLERPYDRPYKVLSRTDKIFTLDMHGQNRTVTLDRFKPAYILNEHLDPAGVLPHLHSDIKPDMDEWSDFDYTSGRIITDLRNCFCGGPHHTLIHYKRDGNEGKSMQPDTVTNTGVPTVLLLTCSAYASCLFFSFGSVEPVERTYDVGVITLISRYYPDQLITVEVLIADTITTAPVAIPDADVRKGMQLRGLNLADTFENKSKIETLIGGEVFWWIIDASHVEQLNNTMTYYFWVPVRGPKSGTLAMSPPVEQHRKDDRLSLLTNLHRSYGQSDNGIQPYGQEAASVQQQFSQQHHRRNTNLDQKRSFASDKQFLMAAAIIVVASLFVFVLFVTTFR